MSALYTTEILRLATSIPHLGRLDSPQVIVERRSPVCGSRVTIDLSLDDAGCVSAFAQMLNACALGQASAALLGARVIGMMAHELADVRDVLATYLSGASDNLTDWPELALFKPARATIARHASIRLPFEAAAEAALIIQQRHQHAA